MVRIWYGENQQFVTHYIGRFGRLLLRWECRTKDPGGPRRWEFDGQP